MAIALVGSAGAISSTASGSTITPAFAQATTAGHLLIAWIDAGSNISTSSSGWQQAVQPAGGKVAIFYKPNCGAGETAPTFTTTGTGMDAALSEWSGAATTSPVDQTGTGTSSTITNNGADASAGELVISCIQFVNSKSATYTVSTSWTPAGGTTTSLNNTGGTKQSFVVGGSAYVTSANSSADSASWTITPSTGSISSWNSVIASFLLPAVVAAGPPDVNIAPYAVF